MAPLPPVPKALQFQLFYSDGSGAEIINNIWFRYTQSCSAGDLQTLCDEIMTQYATHFAPQVMPNVILEEVFGNDHSSPTAPQAGNTHAPVPGTSTGTNSLSSGAAFVMSNLGSMKYRGGHSRTYIPGIAIGGLQDKNTWTQTAQVNALNGWQALWAAVIQAAPIALGVLARVIAHRYGRTSTSPVLTADSDLPSVPLTNPFTEDIVAYRTNPQVGSQRRRNQQTG